MICSVLFFPVSSSSVSSLPKTRRKQAADHAAKAEEIQKPDYLGLQDSGSGNHRYGRGTVLARCSILRVCVCVCVWVG